MAKRIYKAKDKLVQRRARGATVEENVRTKKRRRVGKKDVELDVNMARGPDDGIDTLDGVLEKGKPAPSKTKAGKRGASRYDRDDEVESRPHRQGCGQPQQLARSREAIEEGEADSLRETDEPLESRVADMPSHSRSQRRQSARAVDDNASLPGLSSRFKYRSDDLRDRPVRGSDDKKHVQRRNASRLRYDEDEKRLEAEISEQAEVESIDTPDAEIKPRKQRRVLYDDDGIKMEAGSEEPIEGSEEPAESESPAPSEVKQRQRAQASAFREAKAKEQAAAETFEELAEGETAQTESIASAKRKSRLNFSDEGSNFVHGAGRIAKRTVKTAATPALLYAGQQLHEAGAENTGVQSIEASGLAIRKTTGLAKSTKRAANRRKASKARMETVKQEHAAQVEHRKKEQIRAFHKKKRQRAAIAAKRKQTVVTAGGFVESADTSFSIPAKAKKAVQSFFSEHKGAIIGVAAAGLIFALIGVSMTSVASLVHGSGTTVISTTYVSTDEDIYAAENAYCALEDGLSSQVYGLQTSHPGYDDYEYQIDEIEHNPYHLISYLQVKFGGFTYNNEVKAEINRLFRQQYTLSLSTGSEIRTRVESVMETREVYDEETGLTVIEEYPVEQEVEYEHRTQYAVLTNHYFDMVARANMNEEETIIYDALNKTYGNRPYLFDLSAASGVGSSGIHFDIPPEALSDVKFANMIREAEKYLGMPYVWGGKSPRTGFDCSGFVCWVLNHCGNGWNVGTKRAKELCRMCTYVSPDQARPGDLVFFEKTYDTDGASHVGIYVGQNTMIHCGNPIKYGRIDTRYFKAHFLCFGRLPFYDN